MTTPSGSILPHVRLIPLVEMEAGSVRTGNAGHIGMGGDWHSFWLSSSSDPKLARLFPLAPGWHLVTIEQLTDPRVLEFLVRKRMSASSLQGDNGSGSSTPILDPDNLLAFDGGFALKIDDEVVITPQCCADLADIESWRMAAEYRSADKEMVWIGHPWVQVHFDGERLVFTGSEEGQMLGTSLDCRVDPAELDLAVTQATEELEAFAERLLTVVEPLVPQGRAQETARRLAGLMP